MERRFIFGVDLDGVCADFYGGIRPLAAEWLGVEEHTLPQSVDYGLSKWGIPDAPGGYPKFHQFCVTQRDLFSRLKTMDRCPQVMRRLSDGGVHIRIITHRLFIKYFHKQAITQTIDWLEYHGIPYWDICFLGQKTHVGAHIYIDDAPVNIEQLRAAGEQVIMFSNSTNSHLEGLRADNWDEVEAIVMKCMKHWEDGL